MEHVNPPTRLRKNTDTVQRDNVPTPYGRQKILHRSTQKPYPSGSLRTSVEDLQLSAWLPKPPVPVLAGSIRGSVGVYANPANSSENTLVPVLVPVPESHSSTTEDPEVLETCINKPTLFKPLNPQAYGHFSVSHPTLPPLFHPTSTVFNMTRLPRRGAAQCQQESHTNQRHAGEGSDAIQLQGDGFQGILAFTQDEPLGQGSPQLQFGPKISHGLREIIPEAIRFAGQRWRKSLP